MPGAVNSDIAVLVYIMSYYTKRVSVSSGNINNRGSANNVVGGNNECAGGDFFFAFTVIAAAGS